MKKIAILGSTGSIGTQTTNVIDWHSNMFQVELLCAHRNIDLLQEQINKYKPTYAVVLDKSAGEEMRRRQVVDKSTTVLIGMDGLLEAIEIADFQLAVTALSGAVGLQPTIAAINKGADIGLANKETLVAAGELVMELAREKKVAILPVDSEHSAIFQCLLGEARNSVTQLILTASGGPFRGFSHQDLLQVTPGQALKHPKWNMGAKISIDSATLMNKGLEVIEAKWLFNMTGEKIKVVVHPQSIIHSMVQFIDGSILAHLGPTDMRIPIQYALTYPERYKTEIKPINLAEIATLNFQEPDLETFPALGLAYRALELGGTMPATLNGANEEAVNLFLQHQISFLEIPILVKAVMDGHKLIAKPKLEDILAADQLAREVARAHMDKVVKE